MNEEAEEGAVEELVTLFESQIVAQFVHQTGVNFAVPRESAVLPNSDRVPYAAVFTEIWSASSTIVAYSAIAEKRVVRLRKCSSYLLNNYHKDVQIWHDRHSVAFLEYFLFLRRLVNVSDKLVP